MITRNKERKEKKRVKEGEEREREYTVAINQI